jgi:hypothetical protein
MDEDFYSYHPHRTTAFYGRADLIKAHGRRESSIEVDRKYRLLEVFEVAGFDEAALGRLMMSSSGVQWSARDAAAHIEYAHQEFRRGEQEIFDLGPLARCIAAARPDDIVPGDIDLPEEPFYLQFGDCGLRSPFPVSTWMDATWDSRTTMPGI